MMNDDRLDAEQLSGYFALMEVSSLLQHAVAQQLRVDGDLSWVQFQILARLNDHPEGRHRMTDIADLIVHSRSGLTYQATQLERTGLVLRTPSADDERSVTVAITPAGRARLEQVMPGHKDEVRRLFLDLLPRRDLVSLARVLGRVRDGMRAARPRSSRSRARHAGKLRDANS